MIAVDTNILIYAHRVDASFHEAAAKKLTELAEGGDDWSIPWPCLHEFLAIVTHPKIFKPPTPLKDALAQVDCWLEAPTLHLLGEGMEHWSFLKTTLQNSKMVGPQVHDARIAAICRQHDIKTLWSADRDFSRVQGLSVVNPLTE